VPLTAILLSGLPPEKIPSAAGLSNFIRVFCGAAGTAIASTAWNNRSILHHARLSEQASVLNPQFVDSQGLMQSALGVNPQQALASFERSVVTQSAMLGLNDIFWVSGVIFIAIIPLIWLTKPVKGAASDAASAAH
jgi:DHA2 family multidrug resistance protein